MSNQAYVPYAVLLRQHEEAQKLKKVLASKVTGTVKWFSLRYHYGFIARDDEQGDVFVHQMNITKSRMKRVYLRSLAHGEKVEFDVVEGKVGDEASNVTGPDGADVQGVYVIQLRYPIRSNNMGRGNTSRPPNSTGNMGRRQRRRSRTENDDENSSPAPRERRNRRRSENGDNDDDTKKSSPQQQPEGGEATGQRGDGAGQRGEGNGQRRSRGNRNRRNRNRTISATKPEALEKKIDDAISSVGAVKLTKPEADDDAAPDADKKVDDIVQDVGKAPVAN